jgi:hypothetical protein
VRRRNPAAATSRSRSGADALDAEAARLRDHARTLRAARADATRAAEAKWGGLRDDAARDAEAAHRASSRAAEQANQHHHAARGLQQRGQSLESTAAAAAAAGDHARAADLRTAAQQQRALAAGAVERAARARQTSADQAARAERLDVEVRDYDKRIAHDADGTPAIERVADQLDEKADLLAQASEQQRAASRFEADRDDEAAARAAQSVARTLARADGIEPAYGAVDAAVLSEAGITRAAAANRRDGRADNPRRRPPDPMAQRRAGQ